MKNLLRSFTIMIAVPIMAVFLFGGSAFAVSSKENSLQTQPINDQINLDMIKSQVGLFKDALDQLGAATPLQAAILWADGEKIRNGVYQYAAASKVLKLKLIKKWGKAENSLWVIGVSSPWVKKYAITENKKINNTQNVVKIKYYWVTSAGSAGTTEKILTIENQGKYWYVIKES